MSAPQQAVIDFLSDPASYGRPDARVERVETRCSIVFLVADGAYKLKRAIRFASLDYTTVERRRAACESELRLNARTAPDLYLAVRAITCGVDGTLAFDGTSPALDHVVVMRRFAQSALFDYMAEANEARALVAQARRHIAAALGFLDVRAPVLILLGGGDRDRAETAASLAARVAPPPGARVLHAGAPNEAVWREALAVLAAGFPVLLEGRFTDSDACTATAALPPDAGLLAFWLDCLPPGLDPRIWRIARAGPDGIADGIAVMAEAARSVARVSWSGLARPSALGGADRGKDVVGRARPGHDIRMTTLPRPGGEDRRNTGPVP
ncbi:MAG: hypothetical protein ACJ8AI_24770 [Rhodopila sp.]